MKQVGISVAARSRRYRRGLPREYSTTASSSGKKRNTSSRRLSVRSVALSATPATCAVVIRPQTFRPTSAYTRMPPNSTVRGDSIPFTNDHGAPKCASTVANTR